MMAELDSTESLEVESDFFDRALSSDDVAAVRAEEALALETDDVEPDGVELEAEAESDNLQPGEVESAGEVDEPGPVADDERLEPVPDGAESAGSRGGGSASEQATLPASSSAASPVQPAAREAAPAESAQTPPTSTSTSRVRGASEKTARISTERKSDQRDAIQSAGRTGGSSQSTAADLPRSGFRLVDEDSQLQIRYLPSVLSEALRRQVAKAAEREKQVSPREAEVFAKRLSNGALVIAFLMAGLDIRLSTDESTGLAAELFRSEDPLLGSVLSRLDGIADEQVVAAEQSRHLMAAAVDATKTAAVLEQLVAYSVADRTENFLRYEHDLHKAPITHREVLHLRDRAREETAKQLAKEKRDEGRPYR